VIWQVQHGLAIVVLCAALQGCALAKLGADAPTPKTFDLVTASTSAPATKRSNAQIVVSEPTALRVLAGDNIMVKPSPEAVTYFGDAVWSDNLPKLLQARLIQTLESSGNFRAVGDGRERIEGDVELLTQIRAFQIDMAGEGGSARVELFVKLVDQRSGRVLSSGSFGESVPVASTAPRDGVEALNTATQAVLPQIAAWAAKVGAR
jgi:cholesterol transport system auxiliary component